MKQLVVAIGFAIASLAVSANNINGCKPAGSCAPMDVISSQLDFNSLAGYATPMDVPLSSDSQGTVHISSGANGSAQVVGDWYPSHDALAAIGSLQIAFPSNTNTVTVTIDSDDSAASLSDRSEFTLTAVMLDEEGNLVDSSVASENSQDETGAIKFSSALPFRKLVLTPYTNATALNIEGNNNAVWTITALDIAGNNFAIPVATSGVEHPSLQDIDLKETDSSVENSVKRPPPPNNEYLFPDPTSSVDRGSVEK